MTIGDLIKHLKESGQVALSTRSSVPPFVSYLNISPTDGVDGEVCYLQSQNGNLFSSDFFGRSSDDANSPSEFEPLRSDVPSEIPWCTEALGTAAPMMLAPRN